MAKTRRVWKDMIGQQKEVDGYVFTLIAISGRKVIVDVLGQQFTIERYTWDKGVFRDQIKVIKPTYTKCSTEKTKRRSKYLEQTKTMHGYVFTIVRVEGDKLYAQEKNTKLIIPTTRQTWNNGKGDKMKKDLEKEIEKMNNEKHEISTYVFIHGYLRDALMNMKHYEYSEEYKLEKNKVDYYAMVNKAMDLTIKNYLDTTDSNEEIIKQVVSDLEKDRERQLNDIEAQWTYYYRITKFSKHSTLQDVKKLYRELSKKEHPDRGGDTMKFRAITKAYEETKKYIEEHTSKTETSMADLFAEFGF